MTRLAAAARLAVAGRGGVRLRACCDAVGCERVVGWRGVRQAAGCWWRRCLARAAFVREAVD